MRRGEVWRGHSTLQFGATSLDRAALRGHKETVELLLDRGADPEAKDHVSAVSLPAAQRVRKGDTGRPGTALEMRRQGVVLLWRAGVGGGAGGGACRYGCDCATRWCDMRACSTTKRR